MLGVTASWFNMTFARHGTEARGKHRCSDPPDAPRGWSSAWDVDHQCLKPCPFIHIGVCGTQLTSGPQGTRKQDRSPRQEHWLWPLMSHVHLSLSCGILALLLDAIGQESCRGSANKMGGAVCGWRRHVVLKFIGHSPPAHYD